jgi:peptidoglycan/xylan/chitin deacetylase (PgdA/CDA1 family)
VRSGERARGCGPGAQRAAASGSRGRAEVLVLCYHAVSPTWPCSLAVTPERLRLQLGSLLKAGWEPVTFTRAALAPPARRTLAVTFDDACLSVLERAMPVLRALGVPATVFAPTSFMERRQPLRWPGVEHWLEGEHAHELTSMDWDDLRELVALGWEVGSHTRTHPRLTDLEERRLGEELVGSRTACAARLGAPCRSIAYPYGAGDRRVARAARAAGYSCGATLGVGDLGDSRLLVPRLGIYDIDGRWRFRVKLSRPSRRRRTLRLPRAGLMPPPLLQSPLR